MQCCLSWKEGRLRPLEVNMTSKYEWATILLWLIALVATLLVVKDTGLFTYLGPVFFVCLLGSIMVVRGALRSSL